MATSDTLNRKTRTQTPVPQHITVTDNEHAMSERDESDTEDLSDGTSSDDNWSDLGMVSGIKSSHFSQVSFALKIPLSQKVLHPP
jgi:hypothetical protein